MDVVAIMAEICTMALIGHCRSCVFSSRSINRQAGEDFVAQVFRDHGWAVTAAQEGQGPDLIVAQGAFRFAVEVKTVSEGRPDRVIPLLSQAILEAQAASVSLGDALPLAVVCVEQAASSLLRHVESFVERYAIQVPIGIVSESGVRFFRGPALEALNQMLPEPARYAAHSTPQAVNLFSDLNQWMLKVLLARDVPDGLLQAPRQIYRTGAEFAQAAQVSAMSASRFLSQLRHEGFLDESSSQIVLVRREELFRRWRAAAMRTCPELPMRFLIKAPVLSQIQTHLNGKVDACLGLFAAADALSLGHVSGVPPYVYVPKLPRPDISEWPALVASAHERPDFILRQASFPQSTFRAAVDRNGVLACDAIQVWLDVANHPSRGAEQADFIYKKVMSPLVERQAG